MTPSPTATFLVLDVAGTPCALPRESVREILPLPRLHAPPAAAGVLAGFLDLGGLPLPVLDLARLLGLREETVFDPYRHVLHAADGSLGLLVDRVIDVVRIGADTVGPVDDRHTLNGCVDGEITLGGRLIHALSMDRILTAEERDRVETLARQAAERLAALTAPIAV